jgi:hypothetical protein
MDSFMRLEGGYDWYCIKDRLVNESPGTWSRATVGRSSRKHCFGVERIRASIRALTFFS